eukprot:m.100830 g.100830  ORF g.100830 m.100830 type:complete len:50 (-) comp51479_c0_seq25:193-342(-)
MMRMMNGMINNSTNFRHERHCTTSATSNDILLEHVHDISVCGVQVSQKR